MTDLIHKAELFNRLSTAQTLADAFAAIQDMQTVDAEPIVYGRWIGGELGRCSVCGHEGCASDIWDGCKTTRCPECGAYLEEPIAT